MTLDQAIDLLKKSQSVIIASHESPDADGLCCTLALGIALERMGKQVKCYNPDPVPQNLHFLPAWQRVSAQLKGDEPFDLAVIVDLGEPKRVGQVFEKLSQVKHWLCLDHHASGAYPLESNYLDPSASSSGVLLYRIFQKMGLEIDSDLATLLYASLSADTGSFKYSNVNPEVFQVASDLVKRGVDVWRVAQELWELNPLCKIKLLAQILPTLEITENGRVGSLTILQKDLQVANAEAEFTEGFVNYPRSIDTVEVAITFREIGPNHYKVSFRSKNYVDVASVAQGFGGGGHVRASGCKIQGELQEVKKQVGLAVAALL